MWKKRQLRLGVLFLGLCFFASGCAKAPVVSTEAAAELVWPKPPETPRIRFLHTITEPRDIDIKPGLLKKIARFIKGGVQRRITQPYGIKKDPEGRLYVVDTFSKTVHVFDRNNSTYYSFPKKRIEGFLNPIDIAISKQGQVYISDSEAAVIHVFAEHGKRYLKFIGKAELKRPTGLAVNEETQELLVVDTLASRVVVYDQEDMKINRMVGRDTQDKDGFHYPTHITVSKSGLVYVTDALNFRVQVLSPQLEFLKAFGKPGDSPGHFARPKGIATDSEGHIYVVDALFDNVQIFDHDGGLLLAFGSPGHDRGEFWLPSAIFIDDRDRIYVSDSYNQRIQVFQYLKEGARRQ
jgi:DNA-binding beta-propeller fold protein YncE